MKTPTLAAILAALCLGAIVLPTVPAAYSPYDCPFAIQVMRDRLQQEGLSGPAMNAMNNAVQACKDNPPLALAYGTGTNMGTASVGTGLTGLLSADECAGGLTRTTDQARVDTYVFVPGDPNPLHFSEPNARGFYGYEPVNKLEVYEGSGDFFGLTAANNETGTITLLESISIPADDADAWGGCSPTFALPCWGHGWAIFDHGFRIEVTGDMDRCVY